MQQKLEENIAVEILSQKVHFFSRVERKSGLASMVKEGATKHYEQMVSFSVHKYLEIFILKRTNVNLYLKDRSFYLLQTLKHMELRIQICVLSWNNLSRKNP